MTLIYFTQQHLDRERVRYYMRRKKLPAIHLDYIEGRYYIRNGHHRALAACLKGRTHILAKILVPSEGKPALLLAAYLL